jgi:hypothetical protein
MSATASAACVPARHRLLRSVIGLMLGVWLLQFGAQLCAAHCGIVETPYRAGPPASSIDPVATHAPVHGQATAITADAFDCLVAGWCDAGQMSVLPGAVPAAPDRLLQPMATAPPVSRFSFLRAPDDRPPAT